MFSTIFSNHGILGLNARSLLYIKPFNPKKATALADNKLKTKAFLSARGVPAAKIYARIENREQARSFDFSQLPDECVLKPNYGFGGEGIVIFKGRDKKGRLLKGGKEPWDTEHIVEHLEDILDGKFSLGGRRDTPFFEQILLPHDCFAPFRPVGLPDIRVIVFNLVPVMAMVRIPTAVSDGKANVHLGGIGIGIDMAKGVTTYATQYHNMITELPHGGSPAGHTIPYWDDILLVCSRIQQITNIGYLAVDITIDQQMGPAVLEVNARAGLMVQVANLAPLRRRLERVKGLKVVSSPEKGVRIGQDLFGESVKKSDELPGGKPVLGVRELVTIVGDGSSISEMALIAPDQEITTFDSSLVADLKDQGVLGSEDTKDHTYRAKLTVGGSKLQTLIQASDAHAGPERIVVGRRDLTGFLIDPTRKEQTAPVQKGVKSDLRAVDKLLAQLDRELLLLKYIKPLNLDEERVRLEQDKKYNPVFSYSEVSTDLDEAERRLQEPVRDDSALGQLLEKKRKELLVRIELLRARGDTERFTKAATMLFGKPSGTLLRSAQAMLNNRKACELPPSELLLLSAERAKDRFEKALAKYSLHEWQVQVRQKLVADCTVGGGNVYLREAAKFAPIHIEALIAHEIETHVLTAENGDHQPYAIFRRGTAGYLDTQEGLAVYNQNRVYGPYHDKRYNPPRNLIGLDFSLKNSFADTRAFLEDELGYDARKAMTQAITFKRGLCDTSEPGGFTKSIVYYRGLKAIEKFVRNGGDLKRLYVGKITIEDLELVEDVPDLQAPLLIPEFLRG